MKIKNATIHIIDDDAEVCHSLRLLFESVDFQVKTYTNTQHVLNDVKETQQGCIIIDVRMPIMSGLDLLEQLKLQKNRLPVIMISGYGDIAMAIRAMKLGAYDFVLKPFNDQCLLEVVQKCMGQSINLDVIENMQERINLLSPRERQVMDLIAEGQLNKQVAYDLNISISTVEVHRANIMRKMQAKNLAQLIKFYLQSFVDAE